MKSANSINKFHRSSKHLQIYIYIYIERVKKMFFSLNNYDDNNIMWDLY